MQLYTSGTTGNPKECLRVSPPMATPRCPPTFGMAGTTRSESLETMVGVGFDFRGGYGSTEAGNVVTVSTLADERDAGGRTL